MKQPQYEERDLDPVDWDEFSSLAHEALEDAIGSLRGLRERSTWRPVPEEVRARLEGQALPLEGRDLRRVYEEFRRDVLPYPTGNIHPRFWGWVMGTGTAEGLVASTMAAAMNAHLAGYDQAAAWVEKRCVAWLGEALLGDAEASGLFVSGGTMANLLGLLVARNAMAGFDLRAEGLHLAPRLGVYASTETHNWLKRSLEVMGLGRASLRGVPVDRDHKIDVEAARAQIEADRQEGIVPICLVGNAGTVNSGAIDELAKLADLCEEQGLWFHVDGAFGALAMLSPTLRHRLAGLERADSLGVDLHKWGYVQYEAGLALVRNRQKHRAAFAQQADYLESLHGGIAPSELEFAALGIQLSRGFRALKVWFALRTHGLEAIAATIEQNVRHVQDFADLLESSPDFQVLAPRPLNVLCFRYHPPGFGLDGDALDALNAKLLVELQESGTAVLSSTRIEGRFALRLAHTNHRSRWEDFVLLLDALRSFGQRLTSDG